MKKYLLIGLAVGVGSTAFGQAPTAVTPQKVNPIAAKQTAAIRNDIGATDDFETVVNNLGTKKPVVAPPQTKAFTSAVIGTSEYQLQTNAAVCNRITKNADGTISTSWTFAADPAWADRGTGYNYFDGIAWMSSPGVRIESVRTGFPSIGVTGTLGEVVVAHATATTDLAFLKRPIKGTGAWTETMLGVPDVWARLAVGGPTGQSIHVISQTTGVSGSPYFGQDGAIAYTRSLDGGTTWDKIRTVIPQIDSASYLGFGGDSYSIDANGSTIAIVAGGFDVDVVLIKSTDDGNTWTKTIVEAFAVPLFDATTMTTGDTNPADGAPDTVNASDASVNVVLDASNNAHVFYGRMRVVGDGAALSYFPYTDGLMYWNETMGATPPVMIAAAKDYNSDGILNVYNDPSGATLGMGTYQRSLTSFPSAGIDATGKLFVTYSSVFEGINEQGEGYDIGGSSGPAGTLIPPTTPGKSFRHQYLMRSDDNGATWCAPIDLTQPDYFNNAYDYHEGVYGAIAKDNDLNVHVIVEDDNSPGHGVTVTADPQTGPANIIYYKVPVADLACGSSIAENDLLSAINLYPNPADGSVNLVLNAAKATKAALTVYNMVGQAITTTDVNLVGGNNTFQLDVTSYTSGIYFVSAVVEGKTYSQKLIVK